jgi:CheY-like chemotaxis protein
MAKIMIVDDSAYARRVHRSILERAGHVVIEAATGSGGIETYSLEQPDLVLLDLSMEDIGGLDVLRALRQLDPAVRVIVISADVQRSTSESVLAGGAERFVGKPAQPEHLLATVTEVLAATGS